MRGKRGHRHSTRRRQHYGKRWTRAKVEMWIANIHVRVLTGRAIDWMDREFPGFRAAYQRLTEEP